MTAKYSTNSNDFRCWDADNRYVLHRWQSKPFAGHRHRHECVDQRIVVEYHHEVGCDIIWEVRSDDTGKVPETWAPVETIETSEYGARHERHPPARWLS